MDVKENLKKGAYNIAKIALPVGYTLQLREDVRNIARHKKDMEHSKSYEFGYQASRLGLLLKDIAESFLIGHLSGSGPFPPIAAMDADILTQALSITYDINKNKPLLNRGL